jgi:hypothetical protein
MLSPKVRRWIASHGWFVGAWLLLVWWFARPLWLPRVLPLHDLPNHLARIAIYHYLPDASWGFAPYYERTLGFVPYLAHYLPVHLLTYLTGNVVRANLIYMILYIAAVPWCGLVFAQVTGRDRRLAFLLLPLSLGLLFQWGFVSFCVGAMLLLPSCALLYKTLDEPTPRRAAILFALTSALYFCHVLPWAAFGVYTIVLGCVELGNRRWRSAVVASVAVGASLLWFGLGLLHARHSGYIGDKHFLAEWESPTRFLSHAPAFFDILAKERWDDWIHVGLMTGLLTLVLTDSEAATPARVRCRMPVLLLIFFVLGLATPFAIKRPFNWWMINQRFFMLIAVVACMLPRGKITGWRSVVLIVCIAGSTLLPWRIGRAYVDFSRRAEPIVNLIGKTPRGSNTLLLHTVHPGTDKRTFDDPVLAPGMTVWRELYNYPTALRGGFDPYLYDDGFPVRRTVMLPHPLVPSAAVIPSSAAETLFNPETMPDWDYLIMKKDALNTLPPDGFVVVADDHEWTLVRNLARPQR